MGYEILPDLTKEYILERVSQESIFERYTGEKVQFDELVCSPLRKDTHPTCGFRYSISGTLYLKDFSGHFWGNCFDVVMYMYNCPFNQALKIIAQDFNIIGKVTSLLPEKPQSYYKEKSYTLIKIRVRKFNQSDVDYWKSYGIPGRILKQYGVFACENVWINEQLYYNYRSDDPAYAYRFNTGSYKIYHPNRTTYRFLSNSVEIQGYKQLPEKGKFLVITKSMKDVMLLSRFGIPAIAPPSESYEIARELVEEMRERFRNVVMLYDFDLAGVRTSNKMKYRHGLTTLFLTNGRFGSFNYGAKDLTDYYKLHGAEMFRKLLRIGYEYASKSNRDTKPYQEGNPERETQSQVLYKEG